jgi:transcriptional regulator with XRE-family HTH domain
LECAKLIDQNEAIIDRLKALKVKSGKTALQIAKDCNIPESTVTRILSGKTPNPTVSTVIAMYKAMGGTAADIFDDNAQVNTAPAVPQFVLTDVERKNLEITELYKDIINSKDKTIKLLTYVLLGVASIIVFLLLFDVYSGGIGYFRV